MCGLNGSAPGSVVAIPITNVGGVLRFFPTGFRSKATVPTLEGNRKARDPLSCAANQVFQLVTACPGSARRSQCLEQELVALRFEKLVELSGMICEIARGRALVSDLSRVG